MTTSAKPRARTHTYKHRHVIVRDDDTNHPLIKSLDANARHTIASKPRDDQHRARRRVVKAKTSSTKLTITIDADLATDLLCDAMACETDLGDYRGQIYVTLEILALRQRQSVWQFVSNSLPRAEIEALHKLGQLEEPKDNA